MKIFYIVFVLKKEKPAFIEFFISDLQIPYQDDNAVEIFFYFLEKFKPDLLYLGGDIIDMNALTTFFLTDPTKRNIQLEIESFNNFMKKVRKIFKGKIIFHLGNHEKRLRSYIFRKADRLAPFFYSKLSFSEILNAQKYEFEIIEGIFRIGKLYHLHGDEEKIRSSVIHLALNMLRRLNRSCIFGHFHKFDVYYITELGKTLKGAFANGCMFNINKMPLPYQYADTMQKGFSIVYYTKEGFFDVEQIKFIPLENLEKKIERDETSQFLNIFEFNNRNNNKKNDKTKYDKVNIYYDGKAKGYFVKFKDDFYIFKF